MNDVMCQLVRQRKAQSAVAPFIFKKRRFDQHGAALHAHQGVVASVTVVAEDGLLADGLSTALYIMGLEQASDFWREGRDFEAVFCTEAGTVYVTAGLADRFSGCAFEEIGP